MSPAGPEGTLTVARGTCAAVWATSTSQWQPTPAPLHSTPARPGDTCEATAASSPRTVVTRHRGKRQQVGRDRCQADRPADRRDDRHASQLRGQRGRQRRSQWCHGRRYPLPQRRCPSRCQHQQRQRRQHREGEARSRCQRGRQEHEGGRGGQQRWEQRSLPSETDGRQRQQTHPGGSQHARGRPGEQNEADQRARSYPGSTTNAQRCPAQQTEDRRDHDGEIRAADSSQMGEPGSLEVRGVRRRHRAGVSHDETREQASLRGGQAGRGTAKSGPNPARQPLQRRGSANHHRRAMSYEQRRGITASGLENCVCRHPRARKQQFPRRCRRNHDNGQSLSAIGLSSSRAHGAARAARPQVADGAWAAKLADRSTRSARREQRRPSSRARRPGRD